MTEELVPVVIISLDGRKGYAIPFESEDDIRHLADDVVSAEFDHLNDTDILKIEYGKFLCTYTKMEVQDLISGWASGLLSIKNIFGPGHDFYITDEDERKIGLHPELKTRAWVEALEETDFEGW